MEDALCSGLHERTRILIGETGIERLQQTHILLAGLGGVGGYAAEALARAGVGRLTLIDHDVVSPSNLNRQLPATLHTLGKKKVHLMGERLASIHPHCQLELLDLFLHPDNIPELLDRTQPDWILDAIDSLNCKVNLLLSAQQRAIPVVSSMGAGGRLDPTQITVSDIMDTTNCPLARAVRLRLRRRGAQRGILAVWSPELPRPPAAPEENERGRSRAVNGTISYLPALFGMTLAGLAIQDRLQEKHSKG
ncbi:tRNA threonylcarbamoyladenosine dehydratase [Candidatus Magnetaquicoccus inordinatus]|uniref:tRNA threonylcarbamoyladenosine dehydratase n=1 Tax=Candidatus Magnetaquicoccus inordinatus TaxID=2496818 RepID=UPI00102CD831|nr:tRNA threonylcarbamoyladenosine dehydratase [Candidatus Magnetaquicoccus inordinatus]